MKLLFEKFATFTYSFAALSLFLTALIIIGWSLYSAVNGLFYTSQINDLFIYTMLQSVSSIIISIAIIDVAKYLLEEEVYRNKELRQPKEARETITKIMVIIAIAVSMEGLVYIFKAGTKDISLLLYPSFLILSSVFVIIGLGVYQKLSAVIEKHTEDN
ncbi:hypothetical protein JQC92_09510 [Shewanella sp. 202IG2-18]|uniref:hypothetical protein n=1 Tax=Parashewanella hymeniacidonis TaxID=2807618 RepID=UPI00195F5155|nr:hypothetical protein [Parashewanella hymeniacidonis]MBM7072263.1 hypothetical protein [Parashewanella hymeniacidonis]